MKLLTFLVLACTSHAQMQAQAQDIENGKVTNNADTLDLESVHSSYKPNWESLDKHPLPEWYHNAKVGIMIHMGIYSVPGVATEWFWYYWRLGSNNLIDFMANNYRPGFTYQDFAPMFTAQFFDANEWADCFRRAGFKYVILTTKHHDGYGLYPSKRSFSWNSVDVGPHRDLTGELAEAVRAYGMEFGIYHSFLEWFHPLFLEDVSNYFNTNNFVTQKVMPELKQIVTNYNPSIVWMDGEWQGSSNYWQSEEFLAWLYNESPVKDKVAVNDRWGPSIRGKHGDFFNIETFSGNHAVNDLKRTRQNKKYELVFSLDKQSWGYRKTIHLNDLVTFGELLQSLIITVSCGGNILINVGATKEGTIPLIFQDTLQALGDFMDVNGEAIYNTSCWKHQNDTSNKNVWYTCRTKDQHNTSSASLMPRPDKVTDIYALFQNWPKNNILKVTAIAPELNSGRYQVNLLGHNETLKWKISRDGIVNILLPDRASVLLNHGWALKLSPAGQNDTNNGTLGTDNS